MIKNTEDMMMVAKIFESGSISAACDSIGLERTSLSRRLKALEARIGVPLFDRSGKRIQLTETGSLYLNYCNQIRELVEEAESRVTGQPQLEWGVLNILADFEEAGALLAPIVDAYCTLHSNAEVVVTLAAKSLRSIPDDADLMIQIGARRQPGTRYHELAMMRRSVWATPEMCEQPGIDSDPQLAESLPCLAVVDASDGVGVVQLVNGDFATEMSIVPRFRLPNLVACREACRSGLGIAIIPDYLCASDLSNGRLQRLFSNWHPTALPLTVAHHRSNHIPRRARAFIDFCRSQSFDAARTA